MKRYFLIFAGESLKHKICFAKLKSGKCCARSKILDLVYKWEIEFKFPLWCFPRITDSCGFVFLFSGNAF